MGRQPRQRPISCQFCRMRKLRCSRIFPCSNCTSRGVTCVQMAGPSGRSMSQVKELPQSTHASPGEAQANSATGITATPTVKSDDPSLQNSGLAAEMMMRLEKLEALVASQNVLLEERRRPGGSKGESYTDGHRRSNIAPSATTAPASSSTSSIPSKLQGLTDDAMWLEMVSSGNMIKESFMTNNIIFRPCPIRHIVKQPSWVYPSVVPPDGYEPQDPTKCIWLPQRGEAYILLQKHINDVTHFHHVVHIPSLRIAIDNVYDSLDRGERVDLGCAIILLSICACVTSSWIPSDDAECLFPDAAEANTQAVLWIRAVLDAIDFADRQAYISTDYLQGLITTFFVLCNFEGITLRARSFVHKAIGMAREMALHRTDSQTPEDKANRKGMSENKLEIRRRSWWYCVATDWMIGQFSVPQEGTYTIHPNQILCNRPRNIDDEDLLEGKQMVVRSREEPTNVSYFLHRLDLAEACREKLDIDPIGHQTPDSVQYRTILEFDAKLIKLINDLPAFMSLNSANWKNTLADNPMPAPGTAIQRYIFSLVINRQRCKIHLPYLPRGTVDPAYAASREACLQSAKMIVKIEQDIEMECEAFVSSLQRLSLVLRSLFLASIVLLLDACLKDETTGPKAASANTPGSEGSLDDSNELLLVAWRHFLNARNYSKAAPKVLELSMEVLGKHKPNHPALRTMRVLLANISPLGPNPGGGRGGGSSSSSGGSVLPPTPESTQHKGAQSMKRGADEYSGALHQKQQQPQRVGPDIAMNSNMMMNSLNGLADPAYLEQQWSALDGSRMELEAIDWDRIVWGLDAPFM